MRGGIAAGLLVLAAAGPAMGHAFPQPYEAPLPLGHYLLAAAGAVLLTFLVAAGRRRPGAPWQRRIALPAAPVALLLALLRRLSVGLFLLLIAAGLLGAQGDWDSNLLPVAVWVVWWVGMAFIVALVGDLWALANPWAAIGRAVAARTGRSAPFRLADRTGIWPAVALFLLFAWVELVWPSNAVPTRLACAILLYSLLTFAAMALFGVEDWLRRGEPFAVLFALIGRFAPLGGERDQKGRPWLVLRGYGAGLLQGPPPGRSETALILVLLATVSFDGFTETHAWGSLAGRALGFLYRLGLVDPIGHVATAALVEALGLLAAPLLLGALYLAASWLVARIAGVPAGAIAEGFARSLLPIAIGYHLAHYFSFLIAQGQMILPLTSDPLGRGWDLLGAAGGRFDVMAVDMALVWTVALAGVVLGHAAAVLAAHRMALARAVPLTAQLPLLVLMVGYTMLSLAILAQPMITHGEGHAR